MVDLGFITTKARFYYIDLHKSVVSWVQVWLMRKVNLNKTKIHHPSAAYIFNYDGNQQVAKIGAFLYENANIFLDRKAKLVNEIIDLASRKKLSR